MKIEACPRCLSTNLNYMPGEEYTGLSALGIGPISGHALCEKCKILVNPIEFRNRVEYENQLKKINKIHKKKTNSNANKSIISTGHSLSLDLITQKSQENKFSEIVNVIIFFIYALLLFLIILYALNIIFYLNITDLLLFSFKLFLISYIIGIFACISEILMLSKNTKNPNWLIWSMLILVLSFFAFIGLGVYFLYGRKQIR